MKRSSINPSFKCELDYFHSPHLSQIYDGFDKLRKNGIINLIVKPTIGNSVKPILKVRINNKYDVIYDTLDGLNWIEASIEDNLDYFKNNIKADFYFKRSFNEDVFRNAPENCKIFPLGLNYSIACESNFPMSLQQKFKEILKNSFLISKYYGKLSFRSSDFESKPYLHKKSKILFLTRLYNPDDVSLEHSKIEREDINRNRIDYIKTCKKEFSNNFIGGLEADNFSKRHQKNLVLPTSLTKKEVFLNTVKESTICIATTGLHNSIGWKFGEYVAASRAIISEPLRYKLPGSFESHKNYLEFNGKDELIENIRELLKNRCRLFEIMQENFHYYNNYLRPDVLILNTLLRVIEDE
ncbi:MAG: hypothetical protein OXH57_07385 [Ekhidna sp.]|nr:hypothetical protein [Ekhidna sp.]